jgi:hypothetical protein
MFRILEHELYRRVYPTNTATLEQFLHLIWVGGHQLGHVRLKIWKPVKSGSQ